MKSRARDHTEDSFYQIEDKVNENASKIDEKTELESRGNAEKTGDKVQKKNGDVENVPGK
jgi:uncharacterized protein YjbJ (UPF0337 family)